MAVAGRRTQLAAGRRARRRGWSGLLTVRQRGGGAGRRPAGRLRRPPAGRSQADPRHLHLGLLALPPHQPLLRRRRVRAPLAVRRRGQTLGAAAGLGPARVGACGRRRARRRHPARRRLRGGGRRRAVALAKRRRHLPAGGGRPRCARDRAHDRRPAAGAGRRGPAVPVHRQRANAAARCSTGAWTWWPTIPATTGWPTPPLGRCCCDRSTAERPGPNQEVGSGRSATPAGAPASSWRGRRRRGG